MNRHAFRSVCSRARPEIDYATQTLSSYFHQFSTSTKVLAEEGGSGAQNAPTPSPRQRSRDAANEISSLITNRKPTRGGTQAGRAPQAESTDGGMPQRQGQSNVVDVKSLPRGGLRGRGRGAFGGRGGMAGRGRSPSQGPGNRFAGARGGARGGGARGRGKRGGRGGRGGRGRQDRDGAKEGEGGQRQRSNLIDQVKELQPAEKEYEDALRFGTSSTYTPSLTLDSLKAFLPAIAASSGPTAATIHKNLSVLGSADHIGLPSGLHSANLSKDIKQNGLRYFADIESKERANKSLERHNHTKGQKHPSIQDAEEAVRKVIMDQAIAGQHEAPKYTSDPAALSRNWHLRSETWGNKELKAFEDKLTSMLDKGKAGGKKAQANA